MATKEWLDGHIKVQAYLDAEIANKLEQWMKEKKITQFSQAVTKILAYHLNDEPIEPKVSSKALANDVEVLKEEVKNLKALDLEAFLEEMKDIKDLMEEMKSVKSLIFEVAAKTLAPKISLESISYPTDLIKIEYTEEEAKKGLARKHLCERIRLATNQDKFTDYDAGNAAKKQNLLIEEYLLKITGWAPRGDGPRPKYYPKD